LAGTAFLLIPTDDPTVSTDWDQLDRAARMEHLRRSRAGLGAQIRARLGTLELEYMEGVGSWTVRTPAPTDRQTLIDKLKGLPVEVAPDDRFYAL
jgi:hypothetical protein